jgi:hypothetical protein
MCSGARYDTDAPSADVQERSPIFIGGQRRSGTTLMSTMLDRHHRIACGPESHFASRFMPWHERISQEWSETVDRYGFGTEGVDGAFAALADSIFTQHQTLQGKARWAENTPGNILRIEYLFRLFPRAQFIHILRDPRDAFCSIRAKSREDKPQWAKFTPQYTATDWCAAVIMGKQWRTRPDRYTEVHYEDLVREPVTTMRNVLSFLQEEWNPAVVDLGPTAGTSDALARQLASPIYQSSMGRWNMELSVDEVEAIEAVAGDLMAELGYRVVSAKPARIEASERAIEKRGRRS